MMSSSKTINTGRNLPVATVVGLAMMAAIVGSLYYAPLVFACLAAFMGAMAARELLAFDPESSARLPRGTILIAVPFIILVAFGEGIERAGVWLAVWCIVIALRRLSGGVEHFARDAGASIAIVLYTGFLLGFAADLANSENALGRVMTLVLLTSANDTGGYFAGILFGRHPMVPAISPKKSWEGFAGSVVLAMIIGAFAVPYLIDIQPLEGAIFGALMAFSATAGDLIESAIKRDAGIKDSGHSIPGHGGFLDRIDSQLINAPVAWVALVAVFGV